jgi:riboflavin synthase
MFTGIIEEMGEVVNVQHEGTNVHFTVNSLLSKEFHEDQSVSHNGVCLTVTHVNPDSHRVTAVKETLEKSNLGSWEEGTLVNIERSMPANGRFDGHVVQGHVDQKAVCTFVKEEDGSWLYNFSYPPAFAHLMVEKGSVCINGVSLTCFNTHEAGGFSVTIIPYTYEHTNFRQLKKGDEVNIEFDILGKYIAKMQSMK